MLDEKRQKGAGKKISSYKILNMKTAPKRSNQVKRKTRGGFLWKIITKTKRMGEFQFILFSLRRGIGV